MSLLGNLGSGLGFIGSVVPGYGAAIASAGAALSMLGGAPDAVALNIYADGVFKPGDALWGIEQSEHEITGAFWRIKGQGGRILEPLKFDEDKRPWAAITAESRRRGAVERVVGHKVWVPAQFGKPGFIVEVEGGRTEDRTPSVVRVALYNQYVRDLQARVDRHGNADPVFPYIDLRGWEDYAADSWMDAGAPDSRDLTGKVGKTPAQCIALWREGNIKDAGWRHKRDVAYAQFVSDDETQHQDYEVEKARWKQFRASIQQAAVEQQQQQQLAQAIHDYYEQAADKDQAAQAIANGEVHFALGQDPGPSPAVASGAFGLPQTPSEKGTGMLLVLAALAGAALLIMGAKK